MQIDIVGELDVAYWLSRLSRLARPRHVNCQPGTLPMPKASALAFVVKEFKKMLPPTIFFASASNR
jgi:hypothetical protein